uniref:Uncharacterized protein n=1 Tax=Setaria italica TaxID=4555 RepID=K4AIT2_SETIT
MLCRRSRSPVIYYLPMLFAGVQSSQRWGRVGQPGKADLHEGRARQRGRPVGAHEVGDLEPAQARSIGERRGRHAGDGGEAVEAAGGDPDEELLGCDLRRVGEELRVVELEHGGVAGAVLEVHLAPAAVARVGGVAELEVLRRAPAHRRRAVVAAHAHVAAVAEHLALVRHRRPLLRRRVAAARRAVGAEVAVGVEPQEPQHVAALAVVAAVRHHDRGRRQPEVGQQHEAVGLYRERRRAQRHVPREGRVVAFVERQVPGALVNGEDVGAGGEVHPGGEFLRHDHRVRGVVERLPQGGFGVLEHEVATLLDGRGGDALAAGHGRPEHDPRSVDELEVTAGREAERAARVNGGAGARGPDGDPAGVGDGGNEEGRGSRGRREGERECVVGRRP